MVRYCGADTIRLTSNGVGSLPIVDLVTWPQENAAELPRMDTREGLSSMRVREIGGDETKLRTPAALSVLSLLVRKRRRNEKFPGRK